MEGVMVVLEDQEAAVCPVWSSWVAEDLAVKVEGEAVAVIEVALVAAATRADATV